MFLRKLCTSSDLHLWVVHKEPPKPTLRPTAGAVTSVLLNLILRWPWHQGRYTWSCVVGTHSYLRFNLPTDSARGPEGQGLEPRKSGRGEERRQGDGGNFCSCRFPRTGYFWFQLVLQWPFVSPHFHLPPLIPKSPCPAATQEHWLSWSTHSQGYHRRSTSEGSTQPWDFCRKWVAGLLGVLPASVLTFILPSLVCHPPLSS